MDFIKMKNLYTSKDRYYNLWEEIFVNYISDRVKYSEYVRNAYNSITKRQTIQFKNWAKDWVDIFPNKIYKCQQAYEKNNLSH